MDRTEPRRLLVGDAFDTRVAVESGRIAWSVVLLVGAVALSVAIAIANTVWFDIVNQFVGATTSVARGLVFSSWLLVIGLPIVVWRPRAFGFRRGDIGAHVGFVMAILVGSVAGTIALLRLVGSTPYSDASLFIEVVDVPLTEELVFRAVLLTALIAALGRLWPARTAIPLAILFDALAFGAAHLANLGANPSAFTFAQAAFATILGGLCALVLTRTRSVYPAILLHGAVNAAVVLAS
jgi:membrane protease YdiL (CAAX protease family)